MREKFLLDGVKLLTLPLEMKVARQMGIFQVTQKLRTQLKNFVGSEQGGGISCYTDVPERREILESTLHWET